jgi:uncharacterized membrane protein YdjX (TVP38/TMEM64 family)
MTGITPWLQALASWRAVRTAQAWPRVGLWWGALLLVVGLALLGGRPLLATGHDLLDQMIGGGAAWHQDYPWSVICLFCIVFALMSAVSLPGCSMLALAAGAVFGPWLGAVLITLASAAGAMLPFWASRRWARERFRARFDELATRMDTEYQRVAGRCLFLLRLAPVVPYVAVNPLMGLTSMRSWTFFWISAAGMLFGSAAWAVTGAAIGHWAASGA